MSPPAAPNGPLALVFGEVLPRMLARASAAADDETAEDVEFVVDDGPERGRWTVSPAAREVRRAEPDARATTTVRADGAVMAAFFAGQLDVEAALEQGALEVTGDATQLRALARLLAGG